MECEQTVSDELSPYLEFEIGKQEIDKLTKERDTLLVTLNATHALQREMQRKVAEASSVAMDQQHDLDIREAAKQDRMDRLEWFYKEIHHAETTLAILDQHNKAIVAQDGAIWDAIGKMDADLTLALKNIVMRYNTNIEQKPFKVFVLQTLNDPVGLGSPQAIPLLTSRHEIETRGRDYIVWGVHITRNSYIPSANYDYYGSCDW